MTRLVSCADGAVEVDLSGKKAGRGAYLCPSVGCWERGLKRDRLEHVLRRRISVKNRDDLLEYGRGLFVGGESPSA